MGHDRLTGPGEKAQVSSQLLGQSVRARLAPARYTCVHVLGWTRRPRLDRRARVPQHSPLQPRFDLLSSYFFQTSYSCVIWSDVAFGAASSCWIPRYKDLDDVCWRIEQYRLI